MSPISYEFLFSEFLSVTSSAAGTSTEDRALALLGAGVAPESVASALGVTASRISQLLANEEFAGQVATIRYDALQEHNARDAAYDSLEDKLLNKLENALPMMFKPSDILKAVQVINNAKRRGTDSPEQASSQQTIVSLALPVMITQRFTTNTHNQVVIAGGQSLETMQAGHLLGLAEAAAETKVKEEKDAS